MAQPPPPPPLTPQFCFSPNALRAFLRLSRSTIDDSISTNLNALLTPSSTSPFDPRSTSTRTPNPQRTIPNSTCAKFLDGVLFPTWQTRSDVLTYCGSVATSPDPDDPDAVARENYNRKGEERVVDERLDPYSGRFFPREPRTEELGRLLRLEGGVEGIVRERTWEGVVRRCEGLGVDGSGDGWEEGMRRWRERRGEGKR